jgi:hypothetical protein
MVRVGEGTNERECEGFAGPRGPYHPYPGKVNRRVVFKVIWRRYATKKLERPDSTQTVGSGKRNIDSLLWKIYGRAF